MIRPEIINSFMRSFEECGGTENLLLNTGSISMRRIVRAMIFQSENIVTGSEEAKAIMGKNFHDTEEMEKKTGLRFSCKEKLREIPYSKRLLCSCKDTHILLPGYPLSIYDLQRQYPNIVSVEPWLNPDFCPTTYPKERWYLIPKIFPEGRSIIADNVYFLSLSELTYAITMHYIYSGEAITFDSCGYDVTCRDTVRNGFDSRAQMRCMKIFGYDCPKIFFDIGNSGLFPQEHDRVAISEKPAIAWG